MASAILIQRQDGQLFGFTSSSKSFVMDLTPWDSATWDLAGLTAFEFDSRQGFAASSIVVGGGFEVGNLELTTLDDGTLFTRDDIVSKRWDNARFKIFRYRWDVSVPTISNDVEVLNVGTFGRLKLNDETIVIELRDLRQLLQQPLGDVSKKTCGNRLGDARCRKDLTGFTHVFSVTSVTSKQVFTASASTQDDDYFGEGLVTWNDGANAGVSQKVSAFAEGVFTLVASMALDIEVGDEFTAVAGCRLRLMEDCKTKIDNVLNFYGDPHRKTPDELLKPVV